MTKLTDLKFFLPAFEPTLARAYKKMTRVDYLLTAALLYKTREWSPVVELEHDIGLLRELKFKRYTGRVDTNDYGGNVPFIWANIYLDDKEVGTWADMPDHAVEIWVTSRRTPSTCRSTTRHRSRSRAQDPRAPGVSSSNPPRRSPNPVVVGIATTLTSYLLVK